VIVNKLDAGIQVLDTTSGRLCYILNDAKQAPLQCSKVGRAY
jgi:hypothetical protein